MVRGTRGRMGVADFLLSSISMEGFREELAVLTLDNVESIDDLGEESDVLG